MFDENGLRDLRTDVARTRQQGKRSDDMDEKDDEIAHLSMVTRTANTRLSGTNWQFAIDTSQMMKLLCELVPYEFARMLELRESPGRAAELYQTPGTGNRMDTGILTEVRRTMEKIRVTGNYTCPKHIYIVISQTYIVD